MARKNTNKLKTLNKTNGEATPHSLAVLLGDTGLTKYGTLDEGEYRTRLEALSTSELHLEATREGFRPIHSRDLLIKSLVGKFLKYKNSYFGTDSISRSDANDKKIAQDLASILRTGR